MPQDFDKDAYPEPPRQTPVVEKKTSLPNPAQILTRMYYYAVDVPVTTFKGFTEAIQSKNKYYYYHERFRRVPELIDCYEGDYLCYYEAEMQWRRDQVDGEIVMIVQKRLRACQQREGKSYQQNCVKELQQFEQVSKAYQSRYGNLGAFSSGRRCLMKQKDRMIAEAQKERMAEGQKA